MSRYVSIKPLNIIICNPIFAGLKTVLRPYSCCHSMRQCQYLQCPMMVPKLMDFFTTSMLKGFQDNKDEWPAIPTLHVLIT